MNDRPRSLTLTAFVGFLAVVASELTDKSSSFLEDILWIYGENRTLSQEGIDNLLRTVVQGERLDFQGRELKQQRCLSGQEILTHYGLQNFSLFGEKHLYTICPAFLSQAVLPHCSTKATELGRPSYTQVWGYGFLAVTLINLFALLGLALIPLTRKPYFPKVLTYFIGLAIGTLFSNAVLQLIPEALGFDPKSDNYIANAVGIFCGFYLLFFTEKILKMVLKTEMEHGHSHFRPPESPQLNPHQNGLVCDKDTVIAVTSFSDNDSVTSDPPVHQEVLTSQESCSWLRWKHLSKVRTVAWMISLSDALHNFIDGLAIGASFTVSVLTGFSTSIAIVCEEFPHELGDFVILLNSGMSVPQAIFFNLLSAMSCYAGLVIGVIVGSNFSPNVIFALAGGMFLYIALADMFPEMNSIQRGQDRSTKTEVIFFLIQNAGLLTGFSIILLITMFAGDINLG
ncbi:zinc transporter ZIP8 isoform X2 [Chanos chanos]|uniref:Zinc transporter ZIP8 isoform X2 n=1 Tax=Chanos chanos TaxID=29144 RepID=A0A6J2UR41_CHACN|nr:zinc transporter ZIP8-like isoform X2 [Chanos chanos]